MKKVILVALALAFTTMALAFPQQVAAGEAITTGITTIKPVAPDWAVVDGKPLVIGCTVYYMTEFVTLMVEGIKEQAELAGANLILLDANNDAQTQISQIENLIAQKVDVVLVAAVDADAIVPALDICERAGIPLVGVNMLINTDKPYYYGGPDDTAAGEMEMQALIDEIGGKGNIVILEGPIGTSAQLQRMQGNQNVLAKYPDVKVLAHQPADWNREKALSTTENWLEAFPNQIDGIVAHNDEMGLGAIMALQAKNLDLPVTAVDAIKDGCLAIKEGRLLATVFQDAVLEGRLGVEIAIDVVKGTPPENHMNFIQMELITKDNVDRLLDTIYK